MDIFQRERERERVVAKCVFVQETTAHNVVQLALQEFGMAAGDASSLEWSLSEVSVTNEGVIKQKRLPDQMQNLAERIALNSR